MRSKALALTTLLALAVPAGASAKVVAPDGEYTGPRKLILSASGDRIDLLAFNFPCKKVQGQKVRGRTSLNNIALKKTPDGYKFSTKMSGIVSYSDERPDQNGVVSISGQFGPMANRVHGRFQAYTRRCGPSGKLDWRASR